MTAHRRSARSRSAAARVPIWAKITLAGLLILGSWLGYQQIDASLRAPATDDPKVEFVVDGFD